MGLLEKENVKDQREEWRWEKRMKEKKKRELIDGKSWINRQKNKGWSEEWKGRRDRIKEGNYRIERERVGKKNNKRTERNYEKGRRKMREFTELEREWVKR